MKKKNPKQIAALLCVVLLISLYVVTFLVACFGSVDSGRLFVACLGATIALPVLLWILLWFYDLMKKRQSQVLCLTARLHQPPAPIRNPEKNRRDHNIGGNDDHILRFRRRSGIKTVQ